jgi:ACS family tartrate transporter-like MFS transporter
MIAVPLSAAIGNPLGGWILGLDGRLGLRGWQWLFLLEGLPSAVLGAAVLAWLTERPADARWLGDEEKTWLAARLRRDDERDAVDAAPTWRVALAHPTIWRLAAAWLLTVTALYSYTFWMPLVVRDALRTSDAATGLVTGGIGGLIALAMLAVGASVDGRGEHALHMAACAGVAALAMCGAALLPNAIPRVAALAVSFIAAQSFMVPLWCLPGVRLRGGAAAAGIALVNSVGNVGGLIGPYLVGRVRDATGDVRAAFVLFAAVLGVAALLTLRLRPTRVPRLAPAAATRLASVPDDDA